MRTLKSICYFGHCPPLTAKGADMEKAMNLSSALDTVQHHGGFVEFKNNSGNDNAYNVYLPNVDTPVEIKQPDSLLPQKAKGTILVVDDDEMILDVMSEMLGMLGYKVLTADNGLTAIDIYRRRSESVDLVLLDIIMPKLNGDEVFERLKLINPDIKVICASGYCAEKTIEKMMKGGCCGYFPKPVNFTELSKHVHKVMKKKTADRKE